MLTKNRHIKELAELELQALRAQMNPHFIFNSLNSIKRLIQTKDEDLAIDYLTSFSMLIRQILNQSDKKLVSLKEELNFCERYLDMEKLRFGSKFDFIVSVDKNIDLEQIQIPPLLLQPYLENALWHGIMNSGKAGILRLNVHFKDDNIVIEIDDNGIGRKKSESIKGTSSLKKKSKGMSLSRKRGQLTDVLFQRKVDISIVDKYENNAPTGTKVIIRLTI